MNLGIVKSLKGLITYTNYMNILKVDYIEALVFTIIIIALIINTIRYKKIKNELKKSQKNLSIVGIILDTIPDPVFCKDTNEKYIYCNTAFEQSSGLKREELLNHTVYEINQNEYSDIYHESDIELIKNKGKQIYEAKYRTKDNKIHDVLFKKAAFAPNDTGLEGLVGVMVDITEDKRYEANIKKFLQVKDAVLEINQSIMETDDIGELFNLILEKAILVIDGAEFGSILILNDDGILEMGASRGYDLEQVKNFKVPLKYSFQWLETNGKIEKTIIIEGIDKLEGIEVINLKQEKKKWNIKSSITAPIMIDNKLYGMLNIDSNKNGVFNEDDIQVINYMKMQSEMAISKHKLYEKIVYLSRYDKLTNIYNRRYFDEVFIKHLNKAVRYGEKFQLVLFDLDHLKFVNDNYGHLAGDEYIKTFVEELNTRIRSSDILARYGGDEFVGVFFNTESSNLIHKLEEIAKYLKNKPIRIESNFMVCSFSYGIASFPEDGDNQRKLIEVADKRMYDYKQKK